MKVANACYAWKLIIASMACLVMLAKCQDQLSPKAALFIPRLFDGLKPAHGLTDFGQGVRSQGCMRAHVK